MPASFSTNTADQIGRAESPGSEGLQKAWTALISNWPTCWFFPGQAVTPGGGAPSRRRWETMAQATRTSKTGPCDDLVCDSDGLQAPKNRLPTRASVIGKDAIGRQQCNRTKVRLLVHGRLACWQAPDVCALRCASKKGLERLFGDEDRSTSRHRTAPALPVYVSRRSESSAADRRARSLQMGGCHVRGISLCDRIQPPSCEKIIAEHEDSSSAIFDPSATICAVAMMQRPANSAHRLSMRTPSCSSDLLLTH